VNNLLANRSGSRPDERVIALAFVNPFSVENGLLTQTMKQRRDKIMIRDSAAIRDIYDR